MYTYVCMHIYIYRYTHFVVYCMYRSTRIGETPKVNLFLCLWFLKGRFFKDLWYPYVGIDSHDLLRMCCVSHRRTRPIQARSPTPSVLMVPCPRSRRLGISQDLPAIARYCHFNGFQHVSMFSKETNRSLARSWTRAPRQLCWHPTLADPMAA